MQNNEIWVGGDNGGIKWFQVQDDYDIKTESRKKIINGKKYFSMGSIYWFTNLDHGRRHEPLSLMTMEDNLKFNKKKLENKNAYKKYDNYDAIEVPFVDAIPSDYNGIMGVPITFLDKYNLDQFEVLGLSQKVGYGLKSIKFYDDFKENRQNKTETGSSGKKTNGNPVMAG